jgi:hypothetical protein
MKFILKQPGLKPEVVEQDAIKLADLQHYVEGTVTTAYVPSLAKVGEGVTLWANDDGLCLGMTPNVGFFDADFFEPMILVGPILVTGSDEEGETIGLTDEQVEQVKAVLVEAAKKLPKLLRQARM